MKFSAGQKDDLRFVYYCGDLKILRIFKKWISKTFKYLWIFTRILELSHSVPCFHFLIFELLNFSLNFHCLLWVFHFLSGAPRLCFSGVFQQSWFDVAIKILQYCSSHINLKTKFWILIWSWINKRSQNGVTSRHSEMSQVKVATPNLYYLLLKVEKSDKILKTK